MRIKLPILTKKRVRWLLDHVYDMAAPASPGTGSMDAADAKLLLVVKSMQLTNLAHREDECVGLYHLFSAPYFLEPNSEGTTWWLAMALAIKELCSLSDDDLQGVLLSA